MANPLSSRCNMDPEIRKRIIQRLLEFEGLIEPEVVSRLALEAQGWPRGSFDGFTLVVIGQAEEPRSASQLSETDKKWLSELGIQA